MPNVVSSENLVEVMANGGRAPEFKPPEGAKKTDVQVTADPAAKPTADVTPSAKSEPAKTGDAGQVRGADGRFTSPSGEKSPSEQSKDGQAAPQPAVDDDDPEGENLTEHARRVIAKKHRRQKEAEEFARQRDADAAAERARADSLQRQLDERRGGSKSGDGPATGASDADDAEPKPEDFKTVGEYTRALTKYLVDKKAKEAGEAGARKSQQDRAREQAEETASTFATRQTEFSKVTLDYEEVIGDSELNIPNAGMQYLVESEMGPQLAYHLAKKPDVAERLSRLSPARVIAELGKLEARLEDAKTVAKPNGDKPNGEAADTTQTPRQVSRAPAPIQPLSGDAATPVNKDPAQMSFQELRAFRQAEARGRSR